MSNILVLGDGLLGSELVTQTGWDYISRNKDKFDATNPDFNHLIGQEHGVIFYPKYDTIINCIAHTDSYSNDLKPHLDINYKFVVDLTDFCNKWDIKLVHISTEYVYANNPSPTKETDLPLPDDTWYAKTKLLADQYVSLMGNNHLICRELHKANNINPPKVWNAKTTGDRVKNIVPLIVKLINKKATGIYNVGTGDKSYRDIFSGGELINPPSHVPYDTRMCLDKLNNFLHGKQ